LSPPDPDAEARLRGEVRALGEAFLARTAAQLAELRAQLARFCAGDSGVLASMQQLAHTIHGGGAIFGFEALSDRAAELEHQCVQAAQHQPGAARAAMAHSLTRCLEALEAAFTQLRAAPAS
jgi:HPt (histidine-containing phosphotransfer) domain-containing protein